MREPQQREDAPGLRFALDVFSTEALPFDARRLDALITVRGYTDGAPAAPAGPFAEVLVMDRSLSMAADGKIAEAKRAACAAIDALPDGAYLGVVAGNHQGRVVFPSGGAPARVDAAVRHEAKECIRGLTPLGGTRIGRWLRQAADLFAALDAGTDPGIVRHVALYTDGRNEHEEPEELEHALGSCADRFVCDVRGLGEDWDYAELLRIAEALHGEAAAVIEVSDLTEDFARLMGEVRRLLVPRVYLGLHLNERFRVGFVRQARPVEADLTAQVHGDGRDFAVPLGSWAAESRQYRLCLTYEPEALKVGEEIRAARVTMLAETPGGSREPRSGTVSVRARRLATSDIPGPAPAPLTAEEQGHDLGMAMRACARAFLDGQFDAADRELREAVALARALGAAERLRLLESLTVLDASGRVRINRQTARGLIQYLGVESSRTGPVPQEIVAALTLPPGAFAEPVVRICPGCRKATSGPKVNVCENCGRRFSAADGRP